MHFNLSCRTVNILLLWSEIVNEDFKYLYLQFLKTQYTSLTKEYLRYTQAIDTKYTVYTCFENKLEFIKTQQPNQSNWGTKLKVVSSCLDYTDYSVNNQDRFINIYYLQNLLCQKSQLCLSSKEKLHFEIITVNFSFFSSNIVIWS